jgi:hypothetical protein
MEQLVARRAHNPKVTGSSPVPATINPQHLMLEGFFIVYVQLLFSSQSNIFWIDQQILAAFFKPNTRLQFQSR